MIEHRGTLLSDDLFEKRFVCDLAACKGTCCEQGDSGAPLTPEEARLIDKHYAALQPYMTARGRKAVKDQGHTSLVDSDGELVTPLVGEYQECVFAKRNAQGIWMCGIEQAYRNGTVPFNKPISCHLYPIRVVKLKERDGLNYERWDICAPACACGERLEVPVFRFLKSALVRAYGQAWYDGLEELYSAWLQRPVKKARKAPAKRARPERGG